MTSAIMIGPTQRLISSLQQVCAPLDGLLIYKALNVYPSSYWLIQLLNAYQPQIVFLEMGSAETTSDVVRTIRAYHPTTTVIVFAEHCGEEESARLSEAGVSALLLAPFTSAHLEDAVRSPLEFQASASPDNVVAFLPAKAGSGASTVALQAAGSLARDWKQKVLIIEADLHSGPLSIVLNSEPELSIIDALENCHWLRNSNLGRTFRSFARMLAAEGSGAQATAAPQPVVLHFSKAAAKAAWNGQRLVANSVAG